jgi:drug/metabolite transporter (DMT)-like permease
VAVSGRFHADQRRRCHLPVKPLGISGGAAVKACSLGSWQVAGLRSAIAVAALLIAVPSTRARWTLPVIVVGGSQALTMISFVTATKLTSAANAIFLQSTAPLYILLLGPWLLREKIRGRDLLFLATAGVGLALFFLDVDAPQASAPAPLLGNVFALASGLCWALTLVGLRWLGTRGTNVSAVVAGNVVAFLLCSPQVFAGDPALSAARAQDWVVIVWLGVFQVALAYVLLTSALKFVPAFEASILLLLEPVLNPVWTWVVHGERVGTASLVGGGIVLAATAARTWANAPGRGAVVATNRSEA